MTKTWFITTHHSPEGRQLAARLLTTGERVITTAPNPILLEDLKTRHATTLAIYTADDADATQLGAALERAFSEHGRIDTVVGPEPVLRAAVGHLIAQGSGRMIRPPHATGPETMVTINVTSRNVVDPEGWPGTLLTNTRNQTSLTEEQLRRLQLGIWGQPPTAPTR
jgi:NAD(P)-dependent dehydrogenase (short-subunit alcohol dehydrogenase family)